MKTQILTFAVLLALSFASMSPVFSQSGGTIKGTVTNVENGEPIPLANVYVKYGDNLIGGTTDFDGNFTIKPVPSGTYVVYISCVNYGELQITDVVVVQDKITFVDNAEMTAGIFIDPKVVITASKIIDKDIPELKIITKDQIDAIPGHGNINNLIAVTTSDVQVSDDNSEIYFRGSRSGDALYIIDGARMINPESMCPSVAIGSVQVYTGGVPAKYGDFTGGVIVIETQSYFEWLAAKESERLRNGGF